MHDQTLYPGLEARFDFDEEYIRTVWMIVQWGNIHDVNPSSILPTLLWNRAEVTRTLMFYEDAGQAIYLVDHHGDDVRLISEAGDIQLTARSIYMTRGFGRIDIRIYRVNAKNKNWEVVSEGHYYLKRNSILPFSNYVSAPFAWGLRIEAETK